VALNPDDVEGFFDEDERRAIIEDSEGVAPSHSQGPPRRTPFQLLYGDAIARELPRVDCLVPDIGLVAAGGAPHMVAGYGFSGKTLALQALALSLAADRPVWGAYKARPGRVLHVDLEQGDRLTRRRYQRLAAAMGVDLSSLGDTLAAAIMPKLALTSAYADQWRELMTGRDLMIVDSLRAASAGMDENSSDIRSCLDMLGQLSEATQCRAIVVHHARKPQRDAPGGQFAIRGSGAIFDACDSVYMFTAVKGEPISVEQAKARTQGDSVPDFALVVSDVQIGDDPRGGLRVSVRGHELVEERREQRHEASLRAQAAKDVERVRQAVAAHPGIGSRELRGMTRMSGDRVATAILAMGDGIDVRQEVRGRSRAQTHYLR
jgi:RecA-family ATPase